ncbi:hypothetical protein FUA23_05110 [Neolewinella aurantiaca]|uniref:Transglutaminase-like domain-containing protein n=1 Tax=Neolewinella aurantiaca TaxID=2602767 RepID=A0A5C7FLD9_9BACT|nr:transglutaminase domain-containing protein [Neolewinella aurantiaca]TXF90821.1 hypothetical protein FUA23_05110 [Neolewinella aurantiaca]
MKSTTLAFLGLLLFLCTSVSAQTIDWNRFAAVAEIKASTPEDLADKITSTFSTEQDIAAAIYYWMTQNVAYDTNLYGQVMGRKNSKPKSYTPAEVKEIYEQRVLNTLKRRKGVCEGYSRLYQRVANLAGLECEMVTGYARGDVMVPGSMGIGHAWNAVKIDGEWQLLDCTWGAGAVNDKMKFVRNFRPSYFMTPPGSLGYNHFPQDSKWQLLEEPVSEEVYLRRAAIGSGFFTHGLYDLSHADYLLETPKKEPLTIAFAVDSAPETLYCVNYTTRMQIPCSVSKTADRVSVELPAASVKNMVLGIVSPEQDLLLSYRVVRK